MSGRHAIPASASLALSSAIEETTTTTRVVGGMTGSAVAVTTRGAGRAGVTASGATSPAIQEMRPATTVVRTVVTAAAMGEAVVAPPSLPCQTWFFWAPALPAWMQSEPSSLCLCKPRLWPPGVAAARHVSSRHAPPAVAPRMPSRRQRPRLCHQQLCSHQCRAPGEATTGRHHSRRHHRARLCFVSARRSCSKRLYRRA